MMNALNTPVLFAGHTRRSKQGFREQSPIESMEPGKLLETLERHAEGRPSVSAPGSERKAWGGRLERLVSRLVTVIEELPSQQSALRLKARLQGLKHFSALEMPRVSQAFAQAMVTKPDNYFENLIDQLVEALGLKPETPQSEENPRETIFLFSNNSADYDSRFPENNILQLRMLTPQFLPPSKELINALIQPSLENAQLSPDAIERILAARPTVGLRQALKDEGLSPEVIRQILTNPQANGSEAT